MKLLERKVVKRALALLFVLSMLVGMIYLPGLTAAQASTIKTTVQEECEITNGDFESGRDGYSVRNWCLTAMTRGLEIQTDADSIATCMEGYVLQTKKMPDDNKVAALSKIGKGYVALTSQSFELEGSKTYRISYDYFLENIKNSGDKTNAVTLAGQDFHGISILVKELDADSNITWTKLSEASFGDGLIAYDQYIADSEVSVGTYTSQKWQTITKDFVAQPTTVKAELYIKVGARDCIKGTVLFDNVTVFPYGEYELPNGDFSSVVYKEDGGRSASQAGPTGWTSVSNKNTNGTKVDNDTTKHHKNYVATVVSDNDNSVMKFTYKEEDSIGNAWIQSPAVNVEAGKEIAVDFRYKIDGYSLYRPKIGVFFYNEDGTEISRTISKDKFLGTGPNNWTAKTTAGDDNLTGITAPENTAYVKIGFFLARRYMKADHANYTSVFGSLANEYKITPDNGDAVDVTYDVFSLYVDDVSLSVAGESEWTEESCSDNGVPYDSDVTAYYDIRQLKDDTTGHQSAWQLSVAKEGATKGVAFYSKPIQVNHEQEYTTAFEYKIEGIDNTNGAKLWKIMYLARYIDDEGKLINAERPELVFAYRLGGFSDDYEAANTDGWISDSVEIKNIPDNAVAVQIGLTIGIQGTVSFDNLKNVKYSWDNIVFMETEAYKEYIKDPAVTSSPLYKQSALFAGDEIGKGIAQEAVTFSEMSITNVCNTETPVVNQLSLHAGQDFDYLIISSGHAEIHAATPISAGAVTEDTFFMEGVDGTGEEFDTATFAGMLEQIFAKVTEYYNNMKVVYVLPTDQMTYKEIAVAATAKWGVELAILTDTLVGESNWNKAWNEVIEPAEEAVMFDCYKIPGLSAYLRSVFEKTIAGGVAATTDMGTLTRLLAKAEECPQDYTEIYPSFQQLVKELEDIIVQFADIRVQLCGATIAEDDPDQLCFLAISPKKALAEGVQVKRMGVLVMPAEYLDTDAEAYKKDADLVIGNAYVKDVVADYTKENTVYRAVLSMRDANPSVEYVATAYVIYEAEGLEYIFYSNNDYVNEVGEITVKDGRCVKSVFSIAKNIALKLSACKADYMDFAAIGGKEKVINIEAATEVTSVSLYDVYYLVSHNVSVLAEWLSEGGTSR